MKGNFWNSTKCFQFLRSGSGPNGLSNWDSRGAETGRSNWAARFILLNLEPCVADAAPHIEVRIIQNLLPSQPPMEP